ncbi:MAG: hypothetical protein RR821_04660 [Clostridia bacterium]
MKQQLIHDQFDQWMPEVPESFHQAMCHTLDSIVASEQSQQAAKHSVTTSQPLKRKRPIWALALLILLLLGTVAFAAYHFNIFDTLSFMTGPAPKGADQLMQSNLANVTINNVEINVQEAGYDGKTLFLRYSYRMKDVQEPLGIIEDGKIVDGIGMESTVLLQEHNVGWWIDQLWLNGQCVDMPGNSGAVTSGSAIPGEIIQTEYWRLDNEDVALSGKVEVSLPIGERQPLEDYRLMTHPEKYNADQTLKLPDKGIVTFTVDTADTLAKVRFEHPNIPVKGENVTAQASEVCYSPLMTYITLKLEGDPSALAAYKAENGAGVYSEDGKTLLYEYGGMDVFGGWIASLTLVDESGAPLFSNQGYGCNGYGNVWAEFTYPCLETIPAQLFLAPMEDGIANMAQAIVVK